MRPTIPKHEHAIAAALENWSESDSTLREHGDEYRMAPALKCDALRTIMSCRLEQFEMLERESKSKFGDRVSEDMFEHLRNRIREFAQQRRWAE